MNKKGRKTAEKCFDQLLGAASTRKLVKIHNSKVYISTCVRSTIMQFIPVANTNYFYCGLIENYLYNCNNIIAWEGDIDYKTICNGFFKDF